MRSPILALVLLAGAAAADDINNGDSFDHVISVLGQPQGAINAGNYRMLTYERGKVELRDGKVISSELMTPGQVEIKRADDARKAEEALRASEARRAEGLSVRDAKLNEPAFAAASAAERLAYWEWFRKTYPDVNVDGEHQAAHAQVEEVRRRETERDHALADLEARAASAEARAQEAEQKNGERDDYIYYDSLAHPRPIITRPVDRPDRPAIIQRPVPERPTPR